MQKITVTASVGDRAMAIEAELVTNAECATLNHIIVKTKNIEKAAKKLKTDFSRVRLIPPDGYENFERGQDGQFAYAI